jgi:glycosyltransferase involved in cell wall biosynthesis
MGVPDLIIDQQTGRIAEGTDNADSLATALSDLMADDHRRVQMGRAATLSMHAYAPDSVFSQWENLFLELSVKKTKT